MTLLVGTIGQSVWRSEDGGESWTAGQGIALIESNVRALLPLGSGRILAGTETGVYQSTDGGVNWSVAPEFPTGYQVWTLASAHRAQGRRLWAGTCPAALFYSDDEGQSWNEAPARWLRTCAGGSIVVRMTSFLAAGDECWAGAEIDGIQYSADGGATWEPRSEGLRSYDIHSLARLAAGPGAAVMAAATNEGLYLSRDDARSWQPLEIGSVFRWRYCRSVVVDRDGCSLLVGNGSGPPGAGGAIWRTPDLGKTWQEERLPHPPNSTIWQIRVTPEDTWAYSVLGQIYHSPAGGAWEKLPFEFGEIRALCLAG